MDNQVVCLGLTRNPLLDLEVNQLMKRKKKIKLEHLAQISLVKIQTKLTTILQESPLQMVLEYLELINHKEMLLDRISFKDLHQYIHYLRANQSQVYNHLKPKK
jgi:hypothetical protein